MYTPTHTTFRSVIPFRAYMGRQPDELQISRQRSHDTTWTSFRNMSIPSVCSILDIPDEILVMIILHFDARERLALANSCQRFNDLVFGDKKLLRNLDFIRKGNPTKESDIQQYFNDENTYKKILGINTGNLQAVSSIRSSICKAINVVELNIENGLEFESVEELSDFLKPLVHLRRLSVRWPNSYIKKNSDNLEWKKVLEERLSRITYLSLYRITFSNEFLFILQLCQQLEELHMVISRNVASYKSPSRQEYIKLRNLKFVYLTGCANSGTLRKYIMRIVPDPAEWTDYWLVEPIDEIYLERNVEVCAELRQVKEMPPPGYIERRRTTRSINKGWPLVFEHLLSEAIRISHEDAPEKFCCLSPSGSSPKRPCLMKIDEAKKLLKDPEYQVSYLHFSHVIESNCDVHLVGSAFPNLTKLVLPMISNKELPKKTRALHRRLRKIGSLVSEEHSDARNTDSSFKTLIENTPRLEVLVINPYPGKNIAEYWDLDALYLIPGWKNLTVIHLLNIPITDGKFLIDIGKECEKLEEVTLDHLGLGIDCSYESELLQMLQHCKNLRKLIISDLSLKHSSETLETLLNCSRLTALHLGSITKGCDSLELTSSVEKILRQCLELKRFSIALYDYQFCDELRPHIERISSELNRSNLQFWVTRVGSLEENPFRVLFPSPSVPFD